MVKVDTSFFELLNGYLMNTWFFRPGCEVKRKTILGYEDKS